MTGTTRGHRANGVLVALAAVGLLVGGATLAWACTNQAYISVTPTESPPGSQVTVNGDSFLPGAEIEIRWDGHNGTLLGRGQGPSFSESVTVPDVVPGDYVIVARTASGRYSAPHAFTVTGAESADTGASGSASASSDTESDTSEGGETSATISGSSGDETDQASSDSGTSGDSSGAESAPDSTSSETSSQTSSDAASSSTTTQDGSTEGEQAPAPAEQSETTAEAPDSSQAAEPQTDREAAPAPAAHQPAPPATTEAAPDGQGSSATEAAPAASQAPATAEEVSAGPPSEQVEPAEEPVVAEPLPAQVAAPSAGSAAPDLWSGFTASEQSSLVPGLGHQAGPVTGGTDGRLTGAAALLAVGLLSLFAGFGTAAVRRRRVRARA